MCINNYTYIFFTLFFVACEQASFKENEKSCGNIRCARTMPTLMYKDMLYLPNPDGFEAAAIIIWNEVYGMDSKPPAAHFSPSNCLKGWGGTYDDTGGKYPCIGGVNSGGDAYVIMRNEWIHGSDLAHEYLHIYEWEKLGIVDIKHEGPDWHDGGLLGQATQAQTKAGF